MRDILCVIVAAVAWWIGVLLNERGRRAMKDLYREDPDSSRRRKK